MDDHSGVLLFLVEWVWVPIVVTVVWTIKRLWNAEKYHNQDMTGVTTQLAVLETRLKALGTEVAKVDTRNTGDHNRIEASIGEHNTRVMKRLDSLLTIARNGTK